VLQQPRHNWQGDEAELAGDVGRRGSGGDEQDLPAGLQVGVDLVVVVAPDPRAAARFGVTDR
jgi:hypothetical protein